MSAPNVIRLADIVPPDSLSTEAQALIAYQQRGARPPKGFTKQDIVTQFNEVFQLIGGVPRLALWADQNPTQFFQLYSKLIPATLKAELSLPPDLEHVTQEQLREMPTETLKGLLLMRAAQGEEVVNVTSDTIESPDDDA